MKMNRFITILLLVMLMSAMLLPVAAFAEGDSYYTEVTTDIGVGGTGTFVLKEISPVTGAAPVQITIEKYGEFHLSFIEPGDYIYELSSPNACNTAVYTVLVRVTVEEEGGKEVLKPHVSVMVEGDDEKTQIAYYPSVVVDPPIKKIVKGSNAPTNTNFVFEFTAVSTTVPELRGNLPMPEGSDGQKKEVTLVGGGEVEVGDILISKPGTYVYQVKEKNTGAAGYTYDESVYKITFDVTMGETGYNVSRSLTKNNIPVDKLVFEFTNEYGRSGGGSGGKTGDASNLYVWGGILSASMTMAVALAVTANRKRKATDNH